jgi:hypothetical protein
MIPDLNAALQSKIGKKLIEYQLGLSMLDKTLKIFYLKLYSGTHLRLINGRIKEYRNLSH